MLEYYFTSVVALFLIAFIIQGIWKLNEYNQIFHELDQIPKQHLLKLNFISNSIFVLVSIFFLSIYFLDPINFPGAINLLSATGFKYAGFFLVKIGCGWIIISSFEISRVFSFIKIEYKVKRLFKIEFISQLGIWIFLLGNFLFLPCNVTLLVLLISIAVSTYLLNKIRLSF